MNVLVLYPQLFTSPIVNVLVSLEELAAQGLLALQHCREDNVTPAQVEAADVLVTCRSVDPTFKPVYEYAQALGIPIIYDLDDNLFAVPQESENYRYFGHPDKQAQLRWLLQTADRVRVHSPALAEVVREFNANVRIVWAPIPWDLAPATLPPLRTDPLEIVYSVSPYSGAMFFAIIRDDLRRVLQQYGQRVRFHALGYRPPEFQKLPNVAHESFQAEYTEFFKAFTRRGYAIGLAPMQEGLFYQCKTDLKFRDYAAAGAAGIYTRGPLYAQVEHGKTGILVDNRPGAWVQALVELIENPAYIEDIRQAARAFAYQRYHVQVTAQAWWEDLQAVHKTPPDPAARAPDIWWFTRRESESSKQSKWRASLLKLYQRVVPFRLHILLSRVYHRLRRLGATVAPRPSERRDPPDNPT